MQAIDSLRHDTRAGGLSHATRSTEQESLRKGVVAYGVLQSGGNSVLSHDTLKGRWPVFTGRNDKIFHQKKPFIQLVKLQRFSQIDIHIHIFFKK